MTDCQEVKYRKHLISPFNNVSLSIQHKVILSEFLPGMILQYASTTCCYLQFKDYAIILFRKISLYGEL